MKTIKDIHHVAVIGAGVMGRGIALAAALVGYKSTVYDIHPQMLEDAKAYFEKFLNDSVSRGKMDDAGRQKVLDNLVITSHLGDLKADIIIEAILENLDLKQKVLREIEAINTEDAIIASNTSTIPITRIAAGLKVPGRLIGMHFFNPAPIMKLVEVISGAATEAWVSDVTFALAKKMGKTPVHAQDEPGFIVNRVARHYYLESLKLLEENGTDHETIDRLMENVGFKMGPFKLMDLIGVETNHEVTKSLYEAFFHDEKFRPSRVQQKKVDAGHFGRKTGRGFYNY
ncbi:MAG: 3-hydroxybutyryl-CoA dehydrogenase [Bacteroidetes bacterium]|jgi:3-hydroxybutyryl-CoA dehydrogenase|nr:3-hydroxybutyryl-CoA dehydrogenase [Bacteroidota bacterium]MBL0016066.1 3-hydroxybutyryl-CoA dehydrogenase [Bacteroidota bacterium]MBP6639909.1 3-hydroxybutyryl-CoA dehydrogenase [Bacteroidia bacterium]MBP6722072.1 3-hydroxybutyryl-CoA dehydrogenase [Bacteroidia bacterium]MBP8073540.1 3-hydroxybutyryl-CoA dehydrogenase [Bacteroidia bacterium]